MPKTSETLIKAMQALAVDSINAAGQGHLGMALGAAPITYSLIGENLNISAKDPKWINRDRFVLSAGHGSMAFYSIMHLLNLLSVEDLKNHKQWKSKTPGHPEIDRFPYVDATTGPLGQGIAMAVGMAISEKYLAQRFNQADYPIIDHHIFALHGDGCIQEGVALEAIQLAGTLKLNKLVLIHDYNNVQIDTYSDAVNNIDLVNFFKAAQFNVITVDQPDPELINDALLKARQSDKPTYLQIKTIIAPGTKNANQPLGHNGFLTPEETITFKEKLGFQAFKPFKYETTIYQEAAKLWKPKNDSYQKWKQLALKYHQTYPDKYQELFDIYQENIKFDVTDVRFSEHNVATRNYLTPIRNKLNTYPNILGGSADLSRATNWKLKESQNINYGIREFAMSAINNGIYLHSHIRTIDATFLAFADYSKAAYRLGALQQIPSIHILTHDSYQVGGDGPTHQPFDQLPMLRSLANMIVIRPADEAELRGAFQYALTNTNQQVAIILCRQPVKSLNLITKLPSAYVVKKEKDFDLSILASGSEVELALEVANDLAKAKIKAQVISVPILQALVKDQKLIEKLNLPAKPIFAIEAANDHMWYKLATYQKFAGQFATSFGESAPGPQVYAKKGFETKTITVKIKNFITL